MTASNGYSTLLHCISQFYVTTYAVVTSYVLTRGSASHKKILSMGLLRKKPPYEEGGFRRLVNWRLGKFFQYGDGICLCDRHNISGGSIGVNSNACVGNRFFNIAVGKVTHFER